MKKKEEEKLGKEYYHDVYKSLTKLSVRYLLTCPNNYYFGSLSAEQREDLAQLALDNGYELNINVHYEESITSWTSGKGGRKKRAGYIVVFKKKKA